MFNGIMKDPAPLRISDLLHFLKEKSFPLLKIAFLKPFAMFGLVKAQLLIAKIYYENYYDWKIDCTEKYLKKALQKNLPEAYILQGHFYRCKVPYFDEYEKTEEEKRLDEAFDRASNEENYNVPQEYFDACDKIWKKREEKTKVYFKNALECYKKACDLDDACGNYFYYRMLYEYSGYFKIKGSCIKYLRFAAQKGLANAQYEYAVHFLEKDNLKEGLYWAKKAVFNKKRNWKTQTDFRYKRKEAIKWYKKNKNILKIKRLAQKGDAKAMYDLSKYYIGAPYKRNGLYLSHFWHSKSAKAGCSLAFGSEANFIIHGWVDGTLEDAFNYAKRAVEAGDKEAHWTLGDCYFYGWGTEQNYKKAKYYLKKAGRYGYKFVLKKLKGINEQNIKEKVDGNAALEADRQFYN